MQRAIGIEPRSIKQMILPGILPLPRHDSSKLAKEAQIRPENPGWKSEDQYLR